MVPKTLPILLKNPPTELKALVIPGNDPLKKLPALAQSANPRDTTEEMALIQSPSEIETARAMMLKNITEPGIIIFITKPIRFKTLPQKAPRILRICAPSSKCEARFGIREVSEVSTITLP